MQQPKSAAIRQIKNKYESLRQINGAVENPMLFVQRNLNKCKAGYISLNRLYNIINYCVIMIIGISGIIGLELYTNGSGKTTAMSYILVGCFFGFALEMVNRSIKVNERKMELAYIIADYFTNMQKQHEKMTERSIYKSGEEKQKDMTSGDLCEEKEWNAINHGTGENIKEEQILNQVIGEFLQ